MSRSISLASTSIYPFLVPQDLFTASNYMEIVQSLISRADTPVLGSLTKESDLGFIDDLVESLTDQGISADLAQALVLTCLVSPSLTLLRKSNDSLEVMQAIVVQRDDTRADDLAKSDIAISIVGQVGYASIGRQGSRPKASMQTSSAQVDLVDLDKPGDVISLASEALNWFAAYPASQLSTRDRHSRMVVLGNPRVGGHIDTPTTWRTDITSIARAFGLLLMQETHVEPDFQVPKDSILVALLDPATNIKPNPSVELLTFDPRSSSWQNILSEIVERLVFRPEDEPESTLVRELGSAERVYHRKIGNSRHFDKFDEGSLMPCKHGAKSFVPWSGPKAIKGLARRYSNFEPQMIRHCRRYPNCGVYAVFMTT
jgi:hypothetical protein